MPSCGPKKKRSSSCIIFFLSLLLTSFVLQMVFKIQVGISFSVLLPNKLRLYVCCQKQNLTNSKSLTDSKSLYSTNKNVSGILRALTKIVGQNP